MRFGKKNIVLILGLLIVMMQFMFLSSFSQGLMTDFERMKGSRITHRINDKTDSLSAQQIVELRDAELVPIWFSRDILKDVCLTKECGMVQLRIYWDGAGNFLGLQIHEYAPLTKTDHSVFMPEDYQKLNLILSDSVSILKNLKLKDLTVEQENKSVNQVDGHSGATQLFIYDYVVRKAVYTCYTLWHTVYGTTRDTILSIIEQHADKAYLQLLFSRKDPDYLIWAIDYIRRHPEYHSAFYPEIINLLKSTDINLVQKAVSYFTPRHLKDDAIQEELARAIKKVAFQNKLEIIWKFSALPEVSNDAILIFLEQYKNQQINVGLLGYVCRMIQPENLKDPRIVKNLKGLSKDKNLYVRNIAEKFLRNCQ